MTVRELIRSLLEAEDMNAPVCVRVDQGAGVQLVGVTCVDARAGVAIEIQVDP